MKTVLFNTNEYQLVYYTFDNSTRLRITILKENYTIPDLVEDLKNINFITIKEDDEVIAQYENFTNLVAINIYNDYPVDNERLDRVISIELENTNIQSQIDAISANLIAQQSQIEDISDSVDELNNTVETITPYTAEKTGDIGETEVLFENVPDGIITVSAENSEGNSIECEAKKSGNDVVVTFEPLEYVTTISISIS